MVARSRAARGRAGLPPPGRRLVFCIYLVYLVYICIYLDIFWYFFRFRNQAEKIPKYIQIYPNTYKYIQDIRVYFGIYFCIYFFDFFQIFFQKEFQINQGLHLYAIDLINTKETQYVDGQNTTRIRVP